MIHRLRLGPLVLSTSKDEIVSIIVSTFSLCLLTLFHTIHVNIIIITVNMSREVYTLRNKIQRFFTYRVNWKWCCRDSPLMITGVKLSPPLALFF